MAERIVATYSIVACDLEAGQWGVATQSKFLAVGSVVPWAEANVGAVATQSYANPSYGPDGLRLLRDGLSAEDTVARLTDADEGRDQRQLGIVDGQGGAATYTGTGCHDWAGGRTGAVLRRAGEHPRLRRHRRRARGDIRGDGRTAARRAARSTASPPPRRRAETSEASSRRPCSWSRRTRAMPGSPTPSSISASTTTPARSRSCGACTASTRRCSDARRARSGSRSTTVLTAELRERLTQLGYDEELSAAFARWSGSENLEERVDGVERIDPVVLRALREA